MRNFLYNLFIYFYHVIEFFFFFNNDLHAEYSSYFVHVLCIFIFYIYYLQHNIFHLFYTCSLKIKLRKIKIGVQVLQRSILFGALKY